MTDTFNNTIQSPPPKRRKLAGTMSSSTPSLQPSALDRTRSLRKPTSTARLRKDSTTIGAVSTSAGSSTATRGTGTGASKQRPVSMVQMPSTTKGEALPVPRTVPQTVVNRSMATSIGGSGIKRMASVTGTASGINNSNIKPPASEGLNQIFSMRVKREGVKAENLGVEIGAKVGTGIPSGSGNRVGSGTATTKLPSSTSTPATKSTASTIFGLKQPLRARAPTVSASNVATKAMPLSPLSTASRSTSGSFGMTRPTTSSSSGSMATITSPRTTVTSSSGIRIGTGIGIGERGHARTQSATLSSPKPITPNLGPRSTRFSGTSATPTSSLGTGKRVTEIGKTSESPKSVSKGVPPPSTPGKSRPQSLISTNALRRSPATATPKPSTRTGGTSNPSIGTVLRSSPAHKRTNSASSVSTTGTATTTGTKARITNPRTTAATSTATTTQTRRLADSRKPLSLQPPKPVSTAIAKPAPSATTSSIIRPPAATGTTSTVTKPKPLLRQPSNPTATASSSSTTTKTVPKPKTHIPGPVPHASISSQTSQHPPHHDHDFDTYQQHYTPAKVPLAPKPLTSTFLAPPTPSKQPANIAASAETSRLQTELLQLHLLHQEAQRVKQEWEGDAQRKLKERWEVVRKDKQEVREMERVMSEESVVEELLGMLGSGFGSSGSGSGAGFRSSVLGGNIQLEEEKIQALDEVISGVWAMSEPSSSGDMTMGKYTRVVRRFEVWAERAGRILEVRRANEGARLNLDANGQVEMVEGMDTEWKNECVALGRRLEEWRRMLGDLGGVSFKSSTGASFRASRSIHGVKDPQKVTNLGEDDEDGEESALNKILSGFGNLINNMLAELEVMEQIEREAVAEENEWVRRINRVDDEKVEGKQAGAIWRVF